ncbi:class I SAM-dependent methyltransferase [Thalassiella azotivora]
MDDGRRGPPRATAAVFDDAAATYDATGTPWFGPLAVRLVEHVQPAPGGRVLDIGTGRGAVLRAASDAVGPSGLVVGIDLSREMAARTSAQLVTEPVSTPAAVVVADAVYPPVASGFDAVLGGSVAQFLPEPEAALRSWAALVRSGGRLGLSWWVSEDERFSDLEAAVLRHVPSRARTARPFAGDVAATDALVASAGWTGVRTAVDAHETVFADVDAWWRWTWSHGQRRAWEAAADFEALRRDVDAELDRLIEPDGSLRYRPQAGFTTATRGGSDRQTIRSSQTSGVVTPDSQSRRRMP